jgi:hypothetical protein
VQVGLPETREAMTPTEQTQALIEWLIKLKETVSEFKEKLSLSV